VVVDLHILRGIQIRDILTFLSDGAIVRRKADSVFACCRLDAERALPSNEVMSRCEAGTCRSSEFDPETTVEDVGATRIFIGLRRFGSRTWGRADLGGEVRRVENTTRTRGDDSVLSCSVDARGCGCGRGWWLTLFDYALLCFPKRGGQSLLVRGAPG